MREMKRGLKDFRGSIPACRQAGVQKVAKVDLS